MKAKQVSVRGNPRLSGLALSGALVALAWASLGSPIQAQGKPKILVSYGTDPKQVEVQSIALRPNADQPVYFFYENPRQFEDPKTLVVRMMKVKGTTTDAIAEATVEVSKQGEKVPIKFKLIAAPAAPVKPPAPSAPTPMSPSVPPPAGVELDRPFEIQVWVIGDEKGKKVVERTDSIPVNIVKPKADVEVVPGFPKWDGKAKQWEVRLRAKSDLAGTECVVELELLPGKEAIPGLLPAKLSGALKQALTKQNEEVRLIAKNFTFEGDEPPDEGFVFVTVDGYRRAFIFRTNFSGDDVTTPKEVEDIKIRLKSAPYAQQAKRFPVTVELDNPPPETYLEVALDRDQDKVFSEAKGEVLKLDGTHKEQVWVDPAGPDGAVLFKTEVKEWAPELNSAGVLGKCDVRARLMYKKGNKEVRVDEDRKVTQAGGIPVEAEGTVTFDATPPENVKFGDFPLSLTRGKPLLVTATGEDAESKIREVVFFVGKPTTPDKGIPKEVTIQKKATPSTAGKEEVWTAVLALPSDKAGKVEVTALFTNGAGLNETKTIVIELKDPDAAAKGAGVGSIKGTIAIGENPQPDLEVALIDGQNNVKATATTSKKGVFLFKDVPVGTYRIAAAKGQSKSVIVVQVTADKEKDVGEIKLKR